MVDVAALVEEHVPMLGMVALVVLVPAALIFLFKQAKAPPVVEEEEEEEEVPHQKKGKSSSKPVVKKPKQLITAVGEKKKGPSAGNTHPSLVSWLKGHTGDVTCVAWSPNGKFVATTSTDRTVRVYQASTLSEKTPSYLRFNVELDHAVSCAFASNSTYLVIALANHRALHVFKLKLAKKDDGTKVVQHERAFVYPETHKVGIQSVFFSPDNHFIFTCAEDTEAKLWDMKGGLLQTITTGQISNNMATYSLDGKFIAIAALTSEVKIFEVGTDKSNNVMIDKVMVLIGHKSEVKSISFSGDSTKIATCSKDGTFRIWNINVRYLVQEDPRLLVQQAVPQGTPNGMYTHVSFSPNNKWVAAAAGRALYFHSAEDGRLLLSIEEAHDGPINSLCWAPDSHVLLSGGADKHARTWKAPA